MRDDRVVLNATVGESEPSRSLHLCLLGCEEQPPYGPTPHTGRMFLDLLVQAAEHEKLNMSLKITMFSIQLLHYPETFAEFDGILLPGSFSSAYDTDDWIMHLKQVIRDHIWANGIPTMGVCFGHQILAHAFDGGKTSKCPAGVQAGLRKFPTRPGSAIGSCVNGENSLSMIYTHGDYVESLPLMAQSLGGTPEIPILGAVYNFHDNPVFCTYQAHPEYVSEGRQQPTLRESLRQMEERGDITNHELYIQTVEKHWEQIYNDSLHVMISTCQMLKWFPGKTKRADPD